MSTFPTASAGNPRFVRITFCIVSCVIAGNVLTGCGRKVGDVSGSVQYQGKIVTSGFVTAIGADGIPKQTEITEDGSYRLEKVPAGEVTFLVSSPHLEASKNPRKSPPRVNPDTGQVIPTIEEEPTSTENQRKTWRQLPAFYSDITKTPLKHTIAPGPNTLDLKLEKESP